MHENWFIIREKIRRIEFQKGQFSSSSMLSLFLSLSLSFLREEFFSKHFSFEWKMEIIFHLSGKKIITENAIYLNPKLYSELKFTCFEINFSNPFSSIKNILQILLFSSILTSIFQSWLKPGPPVISSRISTLYKPSNPWPYWRINS